MSGIADLAVSSSGSSVSVSGSVPPFASVSDLADDSAQSAITQGNALFEQASASASRLGSANSAQGFAALSASAASLAAGLPPGAATTAAISAVGVLAGAASGAAAGAAIAAALPPPFEIAGPTLAYFGAEIGAGIAAVKELWPIFERDDFNPVDIIGDVAQDVLNIFGLDENDPAQVDYRYAAEKVCFPAVNADYPYAVVPGAMRWNPRADPASCFWNTTNGPCETASRPFTFGVAWSPPAGSTPDSVKKAWWLARAYLASDSVTKSKPGMADEQIYPWQTLSNLVGPQHANALVAGVGDWHGNPQKFSARIPFKSNKGNPTRQDNSLATVQADIAEFQKWPLDYLYYPLGSTYDHGSKQFGPASKAEWTDCFTSAHTLLLGLCELKVLGASSEAALQYTLRMAYAWKRARKLDAIRYPGISTANDPNIMRCLGLISRRVTKLKAQASKRAISTHGKPPAMSLANITRPAPARPASPAPVAVAAPVSHRLRDAAGGALVVGAMGLVAWKLRSKPR